MGCHSRHNSIYFEKPAKELNICIFTRTTASNKDHENNSDIQKGQKYYRVNFIFNSK